MKEKGLTLEEKFARLPKDGKFRTNEGNVKEGVRLLKRKILGYRRKAFKTEREMLDIICESNLAYDSDESKKVLNQLVDKHFSYDKTRISGFGKCLYFNILKRDGEKRYLVHIDNSPFD